jgi:hypothetical protein
MKDVWVRVTLTAHMAVNVTFNSRRRLTLSLAERTSVERPRNDAR